jgi:hypothetical protein
MLVHFHCNIFLLLRSHEKEPACIGITMKLEEIQTHDMNVISLVRVNVERGLDWRSDLWATYTRSSVLNVIRAPSLISTLYKSPQHPLNLFQVCCVFNNRSLVTASNCEVFSSLRSHFHSSQPHVQNWLGRLYCLPLTPRHGPRRQHTVHFRILTISVGSCLPSSSLAAAVVVIFLGRCLETKFVSEPFASNSCLSGSTVLASSNYATI